MSVFSDISNPERCRNRSGERGRVSTFIASYFHFNVIFTGTVAVDSMQNEENKLNDSNGPKTRDETMGSEEGTPIVLHLLRGKHREQILDDEELLGISPSEYSLNRLEQKATVPSALIHSFCSLIFIEREVQSQSIRNVKLLVLQQPLIDIERVIADPEREREREQTTERMYSSTRMIA